MIRLALTAWMLAPTLALAQAAPVGTEGTFEAGESVFRWMPQAQIIKQTAEEAELASLDPAGDGATHIGRYAIIPDGGDARAPGAAMASPMGNADGLVAARNEKNGAIVLVPPRLKVFGITPAKAQALARQTGGKVTLASNRSRSAYVLFSDLEAARAAIGVFSADPTVEEVSFDVIGELNRPQ